MIVTYTPQRTTFFDWQKILEETQGHFPSTMQPFKTQTSPKTKIKRKGNFAEIIYHQGQPITVTNRYLTKIYQQIAGQENIPVGEFTFKQGIIGQPERRTLPTYEEFTLVLDKSG